MDSFTFRQRASTTLTLLLFAVALLIPASQPWARPVDEQDVVKAVETWVRFVTADARIDASISLMEPVEVGNKTVAYVAHLSDGGYCLCGADNLVLPVYYYQPVGDYDPDNPGCKSVLKEIQERTEYLDAGLKSGDPKILPIRDNLADRQEFWDDLIAGKSPGETPVEGTLADPTMMELDLTCTWGQGSPWNDSCPVLTPGTDERTAVGCPGVAASQIAYYWQWPWTGVGTYTASYERRWNDDWRETPLATDPEIPPTHLVDRLNWTSGNLRMNGYWDYSLYEGSYNGYGGDDVPAFQAALTILWNGTDHVASESFPVNFGTSSYNWYLMNDHPTDPPDDSAREVAHLAWHVAVAVESGFGLWGSGTSGATCWDLGCIIRGLRDRLRYDSDVFWSSVYDINIMTEEIQWLRPLYYTGGAIGGGGHAMVIMGYNKGTDPDRQFLVNFGWGGDPGWKSVDETGFPVNPGHLSMIAPTYVKFVGAASPGDGSPSDPYEDIEEAVTLAPDYSTLIFKAGSDNLFTTGSLVIDRPLTLKGVNAVIRK